MITARLLFAQKKTFGQEFGSTCNSLTSVLAPRLAPVPALMRGLLYGFFRRAVTFTLSID